MQCLSRGSLTSKSAAAFCLKVPIESILWSFGTGSHLSGTRNCSSSVALLDYGQQQGLRISRRNPSDSRQSFKQLQFQEEVSKIRRLLCGQAESARLEGALDELGVHITARHISAVLKSLKNVHAAILIFLWADKHEYYAHNMETCACLLKALARAKEFDKAWELLTEIRMAGIKLNAIPFTVLIKAYGEAGDVDGAIRAFTCMVESGVSLTGAVVNCLLKALLRLQMFDLAVEIVEELLAFGALVKRQALNMLVSGLSKSAEPQDLVRMASAMKLAQRKVALKSRTFLISRLCRCGKFTEALELLSDMKIAVIKPKVRTHKTLFNWPFIEEDVNDAMVHYQYMNDQGYKPNASRNANLMVGFCKARRLDDGHKFLNELLEHGGEISSAVFCILIDGFCRSGQMDKACETLDEMVRLGYLPLVGTYCRLVLGLVHVGRVEKASMYLKESSDDKVVSNSALFELMMKLAEQESGTMISERLAATSFSHSALSSGSTFPVRVTEILVEMK